MTDNLRDGISRDEAIGQDSEAGMDLNRQRGSKQTELRKKVFQAGRSREAAGEDVRIRQHARQVHSV